MSKYNRLWTYIANQNNNQLKLNFDEVEKINGIALDHSFLNYKKELKDYGFEVKKISLKNQFILFEKIK